MPISTECDIKDFKIRASISLSELTNSTFKRTTYRTGFLTFDSKRKCLYITYENINVSHLISINSIKPLLKEQCPRGMTYILEFDMPNMIYKGCSLQSLLECDKQLLHSCILKAVGVKKKMLHKPVSTGVPSLPTQKSISNSDLNFRTPTSTNNMYQNKSPPRLRRSPPQYPPPTKKIRQASFLEAMEKKVEDISPIQSCSNLKIVVPPGEQPLSGAYSQDDFWTRLKDDKEVRTGVCGEWVKIKIILLTMLYSMYRHMVFLALKKREIPTKWYWKMEGVEVVLAPVHLNNNHWAMSIARIDKKEIVLMDSMNHGFSGSDKKRFYEHILVMYSGDARMQKKEISLIKCSEIIGITLCNEDGHVIIRHIAPGSVAADASHAIGRAIQLNK
ncbi:hypothetical protein Mgra_00001812 [Meloidogyne graminicola]|uniref:Ubiquitin-like protease family profile domain-containing protein n=1 Tax=Meloidogyne graminicola TaxID=189291 RepID=A0A8S9ZZM8_9BILA|nr:hypothetical protein Mgra_00001812 [Meloidogyne graminicola]